MNETSKTAYLIELKGSDLVKAASQLEATENALRSFIAVGIVPVSALIAGTVETDEAGYIKAGEDGVTSVPGVFAAGDVRTKQLRQIITAAADGANCVTSVEKYLISH